MRISTKLALGFAIILIGMVIISLLSYSAMNSFSKSVNKITGSNIPLMARSQERGMLVTKANVAQSQLFAVKTAEERENIKSDAFGYISELIKLTENDISSLDDLQNKGFERKKSIELYKNLIETVKNYQNDFSHLVEELNKDVVIRAALVDQLEELDTSTSGMSFKQDFARKNLVRELGEIADILSKKVKFEQDVYKVLYEAERREKSLKNVARLIKEMAKDMNTMLKANPGVKYAQDMRGFVRVLDGFEPVILSYVAAVGKLEKSAANEKNDKSKILQELDNSKKAIMKVISSLDRYIKMVDVSINGEIKGVNFGLNTSKTIFNNVLNLKLLNIRYQLDRNQEDYDKIVNTVEEAIRLLKFVAIKAKTPQEKAEISKIKDGFLKYREDLDNWKIFIADVESNLVAKMNEAILHIQNISDTEVVRIEKVTDDEVLLMNEQSARALLIIAGVSGIALIFGVIVAFVLIRIIIKPIRFVEFSIKKLAEHFGSVVALMQNNLAQGDWSEKAELNLIPENRKMVEDFAKRKDEIGQMCNAELDIIKGIIDSVDAINDVIDQVNDALGEVVDTVDQVSTGAGQVSGASQALSEGATSQAASLEEITSSMTELSSKVKDNASNATEAQKLSDKAVETGDQGTAKMNLLVEKMEVINRSTAEINSVIKTIDDIAFQTNLLALNAAVEAARAGQHGKGFAVVAEEVRNLAARSAKAAGETAAMIDEVVKNITEGHSMAGEAAAVLEEIVGFTSKVTVLNSEVAEASNEQAQGVAQINIGLSQVDQVTQSNTASAEETASAAQQMNSLANYLKEVAAKFKLAERSEEEYVGYEYEDEYEEDAADSADMDAWAGENERLLLE